MKILIVGAGAIGKVYGYYLFLGGAQVSFFVKQKHAKAARKGFHFYRLNESNGRKDPLAWNDYSIFTEHSEIKNQKWDYVILAMSSPALRKGWLDDFLVQISGAVVVSLQPGLIDHDYLGARIRPDSLIEGTIHIVSYEAPLPTETLSPGTAYWIPPGNFSAFSGGDEDSVETLVSCFRRGKFAAKKVKDSRKLNVVANPTLTLFILALENSHWSFAELKKSKILKLATDAIPEAVFIQAKKSRTRAPKILWLLNPIFFKVLMKITPLVIPFDFETYLHAHFTKVREQMHESLDQLIECGLSQKLSVSRLKAFRHRIL